MSDQFWLSEEQVARIKPYFPLSHGVPRVDDRKVVSGIIHFNQPVRLSSMILASAAICASLSFRQGI